MQRIYVSIENKNIYYGILYQMAFQKRTHHHINQNVYSTRGHTCTKDQLINLYFASHVAFNCQDFMQFEGISMRQRIFLEEKNHSYKSLA